MTTHGWQKAICKSRSLDNVVGFCKSSHIYPHVILYVPHVILHVAHVIFQVEWEKPMVKPGGKASHDPMVAMILLL